MSKKFKFVSQKAKEKWRIFSYAEKNVNADMVKGPHIELFGNREITVEGCLGVLEYSGEYIKLKLNRGTLILCGTDFDISCFEGTTITVRGKISSAEFCV